MAGTSFATRRVITLVIVQMLADLAMASLPVSSSPLTVAPSVISLQGTTSRWLPFRIVGFDSPKAHVGAASQQLKREQRVAFVDLDLINISGLALSGYGGLPAHGGLSPHLLLARVESNLTRGLERGEVIRLASTSSRNGRSKCGCAIIDR
ncbi:hypothetical protein T12_13692 [Trichinella patagoniensis]|uniref:Uncharacterized protein n=1 Tax=Trichinella patagoniensis TaxID=990121 RepID=A0A0V0ZCV8_9BILA|nr:hypothetical protein T12_13692 [Trichinella patagoniensis]